MTVLPDDVATRVVRWQRQHGRSHLPWQQTRDPYRVWLSEIMLQQTQVATVLGYYERFLARFPDVQALAAASTDEVMGLWAGLGYYSRARNLHRCAQAVVELHQGRFPGSADALARLPGIGRSTAAAIAAFCFSERTPILDANVRRVITRLRAFGGDLAQARQEKALWALAEALVPAAAADMPAYTQGMMDLGAMVCLPRKPQCLVCPLDAVCAARAEGAPEQYPVRTRKLTRRAEAWWLLWLSDDAGSTWLQRRPAKGIWAGLHCLPVLENRDALQALVHRLAVLNGGLPLQAQDEPAFTHVLTHRDLHLHPVRVQVSSTAAANGAEWAALLGDGGWFTAAQCGALGLPAPVRQLLSAP